METTCTQKKAFCGSLFLSSFLLATLCCSAQWVQMADGVVPRSEVVSVEYMGKIYVFFGFRDSLLKFVEPSAEVYDPTINTWRQLASVPTEKAATHTGVALVDDMVWHVGGRVGSNPGPLTSEIWIYHINSNTWTQGPALLDPATKKPLPWAAGGAAFVGRTLHVFGGFVNTACNNDQSTYHLTLDVDEWLNNPIQPAKWKNVLAPMPVKRNHLSTVVLGGKIYAIGGQFGHDCGGGQDQQYSHVYNTSTNTWTELPKLPTPRSHTEGSTFTIDGKIYVVGGQASSAKSDLVTIFDPAVNNGIGAWREDTNLKLPLVFETLSAKVIGTNFIISHGGQPRYNNPRSATYTRTLTRTPVNQFGFLPACINLTANAETTTTAKTLLFTIDGSKDYTLSSNADWLTVTKNKTGTAISNAVDIEVTINTAGLAPGIYTGTITATGEGSGPEYTAAQYCINLTVSGANDLEAENAMLYRVKVAKNYAGFTGSGFADFINSNDDFIEWTVNRTSKSEAVLQFRYANGSSGDRPLKVEVNGVVVTPALAFPPTGSWTSWKTVSVQANLIAGNNKIRITATGKSGANIDNLVILTAELLEAENAELYRVQVADNHAGFTGSGFVDYVNSSGDYLEWEANQPTTGPVTLAFRYANGAGDRPLRLEVNGTAISNSLSFPYTGSWRSWSVASITANLTAGGNKIRLTSIGASGANLDHLKILPGATTTTNTSSAQVQANYTPVEVVEDFRLSIAPNPAFGVTKLRWSGVTGAAVQIRITDALGVIRKSFLVKNNLAGQFDLAISDLPDGLYIVNVKEGKRQASAKLLVRKNH